MIQELKTKQEKTKNFILNNYNDKFLIDFKKYPSYKKYFSQDHIIKTELKNQTIHNNIRYLKNIEYDIKNYNNNQNNIYIKNDIKLLFNTENKTLQKTINNRPIYKDISIKQILKILVTKHKITTFIYKDSIKRLNTNRKIKSSVLGLISAYNRTIKTNSSKNTITALKKQQDTREYIKICGYSVLLKTDINNRINNLTRKQNTNNTYNNRLKTLFLNIELDFNNKLSQDNDLILSIDHTTQAK